MLKKVQPKVWWAAVAAVLILIVSWGLIRKTRSADPEKKAITAANLDPVNIKNPDMATAKKISEIDAACLQDKDFIFT